ncbi:unnamed protein product [Durusdinium trenchii]|uniref:Uncharacterized protein n=1 Tax=Durusdinium trenchii TaxID=1381693 RepID=A0ABP0SAU8_9DINO
MMITLAKCPLRTLTAVRKTMSFLPARRTSLGPPPELFAPLHITASVPALPTKSPPAETLPAEGSKASDEEGVPRAANRDVPLNPARAAEEDTEEQLHPDRQREQGVQTVETSCAGCASLKAQVAALLEEKAAWTAKLGRAAARRQAKDDEATRRLRRKQQARQRHDKRQIFVNTLGEASHDEFNILLMPRRKHR